jgi:hypothetical protein
MLSFATEALHELSASVTPHALRPRLVIRVSAAVVFRSSALRSVLSVIFLRHRQQNGQVLRWEGGGEGLRVQGIQASCDELKHAGVLNEQSRKLAGPKWHPSC